ncbi:DUF58 domain-containing protein [Halopiger xanaduensis]|uniref:Uncharacterized protein n=1 Tax=Halopiger xanaduensis (strain DSM 18323 / JCM 14033 / SH-6) TaxID=797210 RepID=F8DAH5_HALXS|nr:DUF58 domain-containing protein [Halopiger xanaduensis]AEH35780.1 protein of unknown function DUF58 [Halopiger xanaduensis SH-6]
MRRNLRIRRVTRWHSGVVASLVLAAAGAVLGSASLLVAAIVPVTYLGYAALSSAPDPAAAIALERDCTPRTPLPGERVEVALTVRNESDRTLPDVRIVDGVPENLDVIGGDARGATTLRAGEEIELEYAIQPRRGTYVFDATWIRVRSLSATAVATDAIAADGDAELECTIPLDGLPLHRDTIAVTGAVASDSGGAGYEFHSTRDYRRGDPLSRIDWRRYARTGELGTVLYREQEATNVVVVVDGRAVSGVAPGRGRPDGITLAAYAGVVTGNALLEAGHNVGIVGLGVRGRTPGVYTGPPAYVAPGNGADVGGRIARVCDAVAARGSGADHSGEESTPNGVDPTARSQPSDADSSAARADGGNGGDSGTAADVDHLEALLPATAQLVVCTPAVDDEIVALTAEFRRRGYNAAVISPAVTDADAVGARLAAIRRQARLERLRRLDVPIADWDPETPLAGALGRGFGEVIR